MLIALACEAALLLGRLDERIALSPEPLRRGWAARWASIDAAASARLDGFLIDPDDLNLTIVGANVRPNDEATQRALAAHDMRAFAGRRLSRHLWTASGLAAAARLRTRQPRRREPTAMQYAAPDALQTLVQRLEATPGLTRERLAAALDPRQIETWGRLSPLIGAARLLGRWGDSGAGDLIGAAPGRILADAWPRRQGMIRFPICGIAEGFRLTGGRNAFNPSETDSFIADFLRATISSARAGLALRDRLEAASRRIADAYDGKRKDLLAPRLAPVLLACPVISVSRAAKALKATDEGARRALADLEAKGLVVEVSGRQGWRWWRLAR